MKLEHYNTPTKNKPRCVVPMRRKLDRIYYRFMSVRTGVYGWDILLYNRTATKPCLKGRKRG